MNTKLLALALGALVCAPALAHADTLSPGAGSYGSITRIGRGVKELSVEVGASFGQNTDKEKDTTPKTSLTTFALLGGAVFRYFAADNLAIGLHAGGFYHSVASKTYALGTTPGYDSSTGQGGFLGTLTASYYGSLGGGLFIAPLVGVGGFVGAGSDTSNTADSEVTLKSSIAGLALRGGLGLVFYPSSHFNLFARPEANVFIGSSKPKTEATPLPGSSINDSSSDSRSFTRIDGGFTCGMSYVF